MYDQLKSPTAAKRRRGRAGFTMAEVALSLIVFTLMTIMFGAVFPMAVRGAQHGNSYSQAAAIAQRKIDQLRSAGYSRLDATDLEALKVVNAQNQTAGGPYDFTAVDNLTGAGGFFTPPAGGSAGTISVSDYSQDNTDQDPNSSLPDMGNAAMVTVTLTWGGVDAGTYSASALIVSMAHK